MPKQRYLCNQLWCWEMTWEIFSPCTNITCSVSPNFTAAVFSSCDAHVWSFYITCYWLVHCVMNSTWLFIVCPQLILCIPKAKLFHYRLAQVPFMCQCSRIGLSVLLNWPSGTEGKRKLQMWEQGGDAAVSKNLWSSVPVPPLTLTLLHFVSVFLADIFFRIGC